MPVTNLTEHLNDELLYLMSHNIFSKYLSLHHKYIDKKLRGQNTEKTFVLRKRALFNAKKWALFYLYQKNFHV